MSIFLKRIYDTPEPRDGVRILIDRLWPRGLKKESAQIDEWMKELAPSRELREWYHEEANRHKFSEFARKYRKELRAAPDALVRVRELAKKKHVTLLSAVKEPETSYLTVLSDMLHGKA